MALILLADLLTGNHLVQSSIFGYDPMVGARYGLGVKVPTFWHPGRPLNLAVSFPKPFPYPVLFSGFPRQRPTPRRTVCRG